MKKYYPLLAFLLVIAIASLYGLDHYRELRERQREQTALLLARCVNQGILSLFKLQANDWRARPDFYREQEEKLDAAVAQLPQQLLEGSPFAEWQAAVEICGKLTRHSNLQHRTIFRPLGQFASREMFAPTALKDRRAQGQRRRVIGKLQVSAQAAERYLEDLRTDIRNQVNSGGLSPESREKVRSEIDAQVLDYYRRGNFSPRQVNAHLERVARYYQLLAENPRGYTLRGGSLYFYDKNLRRKIDDLNSAILQGEAEFYANWQQILQHQQVRI
ncbi:hypothetical protein [Microbulbifer rhizosphaerae]|uniref:Uncharacterized protein n=1 Tax=Microbulbifer rhizosphaerae TaxID=1562603 RepID=A0A7W4WG70_9GAMM|nr:hypothetical protein [Microbulbifer rhizosphaerae]MBB3063654.1 hypothetical protein [Microbulbifer rhizosphaerae]